MGRYEELLRRKELLVAKLEGHWMALVRARETATSLGLGVEIDTELTDIARRLDNLTDVINDTEIK